MFRAYNQHRKRHKKGEFRSKEEARVSQALTELGYDIDYEKERFDYYLKRFYTPDFVVKGKHFDFYIEVKGWFPPDARSKLLAVITHHPTLPLFVALQKPHAKLNKNSKTEVCQWCEKYGIAWCPLPIPTEFLEQWVNGSRLTYRAPSATPRTRRPSTSTIGSTASAADTTPQQMTLLPPKASQ